MQFDCADRAREGFYRKIAPCLLNGYKKTIKRGQQEVTVTKRRLQEPIPPKWLVNGVTDQVQNKVYNLSASENSASLFHPSRCRERIDGLGHGAEAREGRLQDERLIHHTALRNI